MQQLSQTKLTAPTAPRVDTLTEVNFGNGTTAYVRESAKHCGAAMDRGVTLRLHVVTSSGDPHGTAYFNMGNANWAREVAPSEFDA